MPPFILWLEVKWKHNIEATNVHEASPYPISENIILMYFTAGEGKYLLWRKLGFIYASQYQFPSL